MSEKFISYKDVKDCASPSARKYLKLLQAHSLTTRKAPGVAKLRKEYEKAADLVHDAILHQEQMRRVLQEVCNHPLPSLVINHDVWHYGGRHETLRVFCITCGTVLGGTRV